MECCSKKYCWLKVKESVLHYTEQKIAQPMQTGVLKDYRKSCASGRLLCSIDVPDDFTNDTNWQQQTI